MIDLINHLGGRTNTVLFLLMILSFFILSSFIKNKSLKVIWSITSSSILTLQFFSLYATQRFIGYQFYLHCEIKGLIGVGGLFWKQIILSSLFFITISVLFYHANRIFDKHKVSKALVLFVSLGVLIGQGKFIEDTKTLSQIVFFYDDSNFNDALKKYHLSDYIPADKVEAKAGKNVIIISLESIERGIFSDQFNPIAKNLHSLKNEWNYLKIQQNTGSSWTSGSLYTFMTGFPAFFGTEKNGIFQNAYHSNISSIGNVFSKSNYNSSYLIGSANISGISEMLRCFKIDKVIDYTNTTDKGTKSWFGLKDKDVFDEAKDEINRLSKLKNPYAVIISTTDTHFPDGIYDARMKDYVPKELSKMEYSIASLDYLLNDFIKYLEQNNLLENTSIFIFPDHKKMGDPGIYQGTGERGLFMISNEDLSEFDHQELYQLDLPKIILSAAGIDHNLTFLTDFIEGNKEQYIREHIYELTEINSKGILNPRVEQFDAKAISKNYFKYKKDRSKFIAQAGGVIDGRSNTNSLEALNSSYNKGFRIFELDILSTLDDYFIGAQSWGAFHHMTNKKSDSIVNHSEFMTAKLYGKYSVLDIRLINDWFSEHPDAILLTDRINSPIHFSKQFIDKDRLMMQVYDKTALNEAIQLNLNAVIPRVELLKEMDEAEIKKYVNIGIEFYTIEYNNTVDENNTVNYFSSLGLQPIYYGLDLSSYDVDYFVKYHMDDVKALIVDDYNFEKK
ncbi:sulfatase-like hydrolase/transferase [Flammeovirga yaeyamensis]|uniref:Sulfatase-like hydrolase/transferase n=1 Tax=Flammeovirga yaeyamensis TaxID=367791 RepID=A0AAX1NDB1_9BACT|nr:sulfatase-like hydrolase/transferase [Flammeovirga yaeyamensis]MBB3699188.1 hypothetical protein [Flammeovirga yaeyamensis]NMF35548.1 sulfatase-like hydrolase/transferase [Flammeovirga yaeyamensis]QWG04406.1 sulfatase-like hydrolase/transferase [Flammeovirga yaeyamensis]